MECCIFPIIWIGKKWGLGIERRFAEAEIKVRKKKSAMPVTKH